MGLHAIWGPLIAATSACPVTLQASPPQPPWACMRAALCTHRRRPPPAAVGDSPWLVGSVGRVGVLELDWSNKEHYAGLAPPYDYILAADCVYSELAGARAVQVVVGGDGRWWGDS